MAQKLLSTDPNAGLSAAPAARHPSGGLLSTDPNAGLPGASTVATFNIPLVWKNGRMVDVDPVTGKTVEPERERTLWEIANTPLVPQVQQAGQALSEKIREPRLGYEGPFDPEKNKNEINTAMMKGFAGGAIEGASDVVASFTSPVGIATTLANLKPAGFIASKIPQVAAALRNLRVQQAQKTVGTVAGAAFAAHGADRVIEDPSLAGKAEGVVEMATGALPLAHAAGLPATQAAAAAGRIKKGRTLLSDALNIKSAKSKITEAEFETALQRVYPRHTPDDPIQFLDQVAQRARDTSNEMSEVIGAVAQHFSNEHIPTQPLNEIATRGASNPQGGGGPNSRFVQAGRRAMMQLYPQLGHYEPVLNARGQQVGSRLVHDPISYPDAVELLKSVNKQLNDRLGPSTARLKRTDKIANDPTYAALDAVANALRDGISDGLEGLGVPGVAEFRHDQRAVIKLQQAAEKVEGTGHTNFSSTTPPSPVKKLAQKGLPYVGGTVGAAIGYDLGGAVGAAEGTAVGAGAGKLAAELLNRRLTRDAAVKKAFELMQRPPVGSTPSVPPGGPRRPTAWPGGPAGGSSAPGGRGPTGGGGPRGGQPGGGGGPRGAGPTPGGGRRPDETWQEWGRRNGVPPNWWNAGGAPGEPWGPRPPEWEAVPSESGRPTGDEPWVDGEIVPGGVLPPGYRKVWDALNAPETARQLSAPAPAGPQPGAGDRPTAAQRAAARLREREARAAEDAQLENEALDSLAARLFAAGKPGTIAEHREALHDQLRDLEYFDRELAAEGGDHREILKFLADEGGLSSTAENEGRGELNWLKEFRDLKPVLKNGKVVRHTFADTINGVKGVFRQASQKVAGGRSGAQTLATMLERIQESGKFPEITTENDLVEAIRAAATAKQPKPANLIKSLIVATERDITARGEAAALDAEEAARVMKEWDDIINGPDEPPAAPVVDTLDTGEGQTRLPGTEGARRPGNAPTMRAPVQATGNDFNLEAPNAAEVDAAAAADAQPNIFGPPAEPGSVDIRQALSTIRQHGYDIESYNDKKGWLLSDVGVSDSGRSTGRTRRRSVPDVVTRALKVFNQISEAEGERLINE